MENKNYQDLWSYALDLLSYETNKTSFNAWFSKLKIKDVDENNDIIYLIYDKPMQKDIIQERFSKVLHKSIEEAFSKPYGVKFIYENEQTNFNKNQSNNQISTTSTINEIFDQENIINVRNTFDNFVVGSKNEYAYAVSLAVAEYPAHPNYNPLYLYGEPGLGKTHLMHAIGMYTLQNFKDKKVLYVTSEMFTNEFISAIKNKTMDIFRNKYREMDVLLLDDVQFFKGKENVQEEVFNTFNALHDNNKQIVLSSDRKPVELEISDRLRQRFGWKIIANIDKPDFETRVAILEKKAEQENLILDNNLLETINIIANNIKDSVRELESAFINVLNIARFQGLKLTPEFLKEKASYLFPTENTQIDVDGIKNIVSQYFNITIKDLEGTNRSKNIAHPRQIAVYLTRELTNMPFSSIGQSFGNKDHSTIIHSHKKISDELKNNEHTKFIVNEIMNKIKI